MFILLVLSLLPFPLVSSPSLVSSSSSRSSHLLSKPLLSSPFCFLVSSPATNSLLSSHLVSCLISLFLPSPFLFLCLLIFSTLLLSSSALFPLHPSSFLFHLFVSYPLISFCLLSSCPLVLSPLLSCPCFLPFSHTCITPLPPPTPSVHGHMLLCRSVPLLARLRLATTCCVDPDSSNGASVSACGRGNEAAHSLEQKTTDSELIIVDRRGVKHCGPNSIFMRERRMGRRRDVEHRRRGGGSGGRGKLRKIWLEEGKE